MKAIERCGLAGVEALVGKMDGSASSTPPVFWLRWAGNVREEHSLERVRARRRLLLKARGHSLCAVLAEKLRSALGDR